MVSNESTEIEDAVLLTGCTVLGAERDDFLSGASIWAGLVGAVDDTVGEVSITAEADNIRGTLGAA